MTKVPLTLLAEPWCIMASLRVPAMLTKVAATPDWSITFPFYMPHGKMTDGENRGNSSRSTKALLCVVVTLCQLKPEFLQGLLCVPLLAYAHFVCRCRY